MAYLIAGPMVALVGIVAVFFVLRRKSVEKRSMYSARRSQIEHKVRAARQRTLVTGRHSDRQTPAPAPTFDYPPAQAAPAEPEWSPPAPEPFRPAPEATPMAPSQPAWTPAPAPATEPVAPFEPAAASASATAAGAWSVV